MHYCKNFWKIFILKNRKEAEMLKYKKLNLKNDSLCGIELKTLNGRIFKLAVVKDKRNREYFCFVNENTSIEIYSGGETGCGGYYNETLEYRNLSFVRYVDSTDIESEEIKMDTDKKDSRNTFDLLKNKIALQIANVCNQRSNRIVELFCLTLTNANFHSELTELLPELNRIFDLSPENNEQ